MIYTQERINGHGYILESALYDNFKKLFKENKLYIEKCINQRESISEKDKQHYKNITAERLKAQNEFLMYNCVINYNQYKYWLNKINNQIKFNDFKII